MLTLFAPGPALNRLNASPFCLKLECFLLYHAIPYQKQPARPNQGPFQKVPFVELEGERIGDSSLIIDLLQKKWPHCRDDLTPLQQATGHAWQSLVEDHLYWTLVYSRWVEEDSWPVLRNAFFSEVPWLLRRVISDKVRKQVIKSLYAQGTGRFPAELVYAQAEKDLSALSEHLSHHEFITGDRFSRFDLAVWAVLSNILLAIPKTPLTEIAGRYTALTGYCNRIESLVSDLAPPAVQEQAVDKRKLVAS